MTMMGLDIEAIEALDFEFAPPCEQKEDCDNEAEWKVVPSCCGRTILFCTPCKDALVEGLINVRFIVDTACGNLGQSILSIEPLN